MRISPPEVVVYSGCTSEEAFDIVWDHRLRNCEPAPRLITVILFHHDRDLLAFRFKFSEGIQFDGQLAFVDPEQKATAIAFIEEYGFMDRIARHELLAVRFWDTVDRQTFEAALGSAPEH